MNLCPYYLRILDKISMYHSYISLSNWGGIESITISNLKFLLLHIFYELPKSHKKHPILKIKIYISLHKDSIVDSPPPNISVLPGNNSFFVVFVRSLLCAFTSLLAVEIVNMWSPQEKQSFQPTMFQFFPYKCGCYPTRNLCWLPTKYCASI